MAHSNATDFYCFRQDFISSFSRITKNTTPGDAAFLRILIESSRAERGLEIGTATGYGAIIRASDEKDDGMAVIYKGQR